MGDKQAPKAPDLPKEVPDDLRKFLECAPGASATLKDGALGWVDFGEDLKGWMKEGAKPGLKIAPGAKPGTATITVTLPTKLGEVGLDLPASITEGQLAVDTGSLPGIVPQSFKDNITKSVKDINDWFKHNGKGFGPPKFGKDGVTLTKVDLAPPPGQAEPAPTPAKEEPKVEPKPEPKPVPVPKEKEPDYLETQYVEPPTLPTPEVFNPKAPKPVVGAGGPGGPKAPVGLGGMVSNYLLYLVLAAIVAVLGVGIFVVGPALGLFGTGPAATPTPTSPLAVTTPTPTPGEVPTPTATPAPRIVLSDDGLAMLSIPFGAAPPDAPITITALGQADAPPELASVNFRSAFYRIGPPELTFTLPVTFGRTVDLTALGIDPVVDGYPLISLAQRSSAGTWSWLADQSSLIGGVDGTEPATEMYQMATVTSMGDVFGFGGQASIDVTAIELSRGIQLEVGRSVDLGLTFVSDAPISILAFEGFASVSGIVDITAPAASIGPYPGGSIIWHFTCQSAGEVVAALGHTLRTGSNELLDSLGIQVGEWTTTLKLHHAVSCLSPTTTEEPPIAFPELTGGCVSVVHKPLAGRFPSYLEWILNFDPFSLPSDARVVLTLAEEGSSDVTYEAAIVTTSYAEGRATLQTGITKFGLKIFKRLEVVGADGMRYNLTPDLKALFGEGVRVTEKEGSLAGNACP